MCLACVLGRTCFRLADTHQALPWCQAWARYEGCREEQDRSILKKTHSENKETEVVIKTSSGQGYGKAKAMCRGAPSPDPARIQSRVLECLHGFTLGSFFICHWSHLNGKRPRATGQLIRKTRWDSCLGPGRTSVNPDFGTKFTDLDTFSSL